MWNALCTDSSQVTETIVGSTPPLSMFVRGKHLKPLLFAPVNITATLNVYFNCISTPYVLLSTSFSNKFWSFYGKLMDLPWIEASAALMMRSALFWNTAAVITQKSGDLYGLYSLNCIFMVPCIVTLY